jgi:hypothetical protein
MFASHIFSHKEFVDIICNKVRNGYEMFHYVHVPFRGVGNPVAPAPSDQDIRESIEAYMSAPSDETCKNVVAILSTFNPSKVEWWNPALGSLGSMVMQFDDDLVIACDSPMKLVTMMSRQVVDKDISLEDYLERCSKTSLAKSGIPLQEWMDLCTNIYNLHNSGRRFIPSFGDWKRRSCTLKDAQKEESSTQHRVTRSMKNRTSIIHKILEDVKNDRLTA